MNLRPVILALFLLLIFGGYTPATEAAREVTTFEIPDVNDDFCGPKMQIAFCRCAFEGEGCDVVKMEQAAARDFVEREYKEWVGQRIATVANECLAKDGFWNTPTRQCFTCTDGEVRDGKECLPPGSTLTAEKTEQCALATKFAEDWQTLSDFSKTEGEVSEPVTNYRNRFQELLFSVRNAAQYQQQLGLSATILDQIRRYRTALRDGIALDRDTAFSELVHTQSKVPSEVERAVTPVKSLLSAEGFSEGVTAIFTVASTSEAISIFTIPTKEAFEKDIKPGTAYERIAATITTFGSDVAGAFTSYLGTTQVLPFSEADQAFMQTEHYESNLIDAVYAATAAQAALTRKALLAEQNYLGGLYNETEALRKAEYERVATTVASSCQQ